MANRIENAKAMTDIQGFFKKGERTKIYRSAETLRDKVLIRLLWKTGRRISEVLGIKLEDIDFENKMIYWNILKKKEKLRSVKPIDQKTLDLLEYYIYENNKRNPHMKFQPDYYLLHNGNPYQHISRIRAFQIVRRLCKKAGIEKVGNKKPHPHHFRHSFAIDLSRKAKTVGGIRMVQQTLEHSSLQMTEQYLQFSPEDLREIIEGLEEDD